MRGWWGTLASLSEALHGDAAQSSTQHPHDVVRGAWMMYNNIACWTLWASKATHAPCSYPSAGWRACACRHGRFNRRPYLTTGRVPARQRALRRALRQSLRGRAQRPAAPGQPGTSAGSHTRACRQSAGPPGTPISCRWPLRRAEAGLLAGGFRPCRRTARTVTQAAVFIEPDERHASELWTRVSKCCERGSGARHISALVHSRTAWTKCYPHIRSLHIASISSFKRGRTRQRRAAPQLGRLRDAALLVREHGRLGRLARGRVRRVAAVARVGAAARLAPGQPARQHLHQHVQPGPQVVAPAWPPRASASALLCGGCACGPLRIRAAAGSRQGRLPVSMSTGRYDQNHSSQWAFHVERTACPAAGRPSENL